MLLLWCTNICRVGNLVGVLWHLNLWFIIYHITRLNRCVHIQALFLMATLMARCQSLLGQVATCPGWRALLALAIGDVGTSPGACARHACLLGGESPLYNQMEVKY